MTNGRDKLSKAETVLIAAIEIGLPQLVAAREIIANFRQMIRTKAVATMALWMERAADSPGGVILQRRQKGRRGRSSRHNLTLVERTDRGPDHEARARQTPDVPPGKDRPAPGTPHRRSLSPTCSESASDPKLNAV